MDQEDAVTQPSPHRRVSERTRLLVAGLVLVLIGLLVWWRYQYGGPSFSDFHLTDVSERLPAMVQEAEKRAQTSWQSEAGLIVVSLTIERGRVKEEFPPVAFFASPANEVDNFFVEMNTDLTQITETGTEYKSPYQPAVELLRLYPDEWTVSAEDALRTVEQSGGGDFRSVHPDYRIIMELTKTHTAGAEWSVTYADQAAVEDSILFQAHVNAKTGELTNVEQ